MNKETHNEKALKLIQHPFWFIKALDDREREAVRLASRGLNVAKIIAPQMGVTYAVVYKYLGRAVRKINDQTGADITLSDLTDLHLTLIEESLKDG